MPRKYLGPIDPREAQVTHREPVEPPLLAEPVAASEVA
jgi:hypothetical protein